MIKIVSGIYRSRELTLPPLDKVRPTQDILRKAVFSALGEHLVGYTVLDLFAGSGAYGFEALSRGAVKAVFVDSEAQCLKAISDSARRLGCTAEAVLINSDYRKALLRLAEQKYSFDAVFMDPPYELEVNKDIIVELKERGLLKSSGVIVAEQEKEPEPLEGFSLKTYKYSYKKVGIYRIKEQIK